MVLPGYMALLNHPSLSFFICQMGVIIVPTSLGPLEPRMSEFTECLAWLGQEEE